jgi:hypothetical protein
LLKLRRNLPKAHVKESYKVVGVDPSKQHGGCDKERVWKLEVKLEKYTKHVSALTMSRSWLESQDIKDASVCSLPRKWELLSVMDMNGW